jgi:hypothetical protein
MHHILACNDTVFCFPCRCMQAPALPKTRSGKIMRRILRKIAAGGWAPLSSRVPGCELLLMQTFEEALCTRSHGLQPCRACSVP